MMIKNSCYTSEPSHTDANEGLQDVLGHDVRVARLPNVFTVHIPWLVQAGQERPVECHLLALTSPPRERSLDQLETLSIHASLSYAFV